MQLDCVADADVEELVVLGAIVDDEDGQGPGPVGGGSPPAFVMRTKKPAFACKVIAKSTRVHIPVAVSY
jgi:hypothetical protein